MALKFGVKKVGDETGESPTADSAQIEFFCPGCGKAFQQSARAAGKKTKCPKCETVFAIPATVPAKPAAAPNVEPAEAPVAAVAAGDTEAAVAAAVAAYNAGKSQRAAGSPRWIVPTGLLLLLLGAILSTSGSWMMVRGYMKTFALEELLGGNGGDLKTLLGGIFGGRNQILQDLQADIDNPNRRRPQPNRPNTLPDAGKLLAQAEARQKGLQQQLEERQSNREAGQSLVLWGVVTHGAGKLASFIGGIFLLAGLIGRYIRPASPASESTARSP